MEMAISSADFYEWICLYNGITCVSNSEINLSFIEVKNNLKNYYLYFV